MRRRSMRCLIGRDDLAMLREDPYPVRAYVRVYQGLWSIEREDDSIDDGLELARGLGGRSRGATEHAHEGLQLVPSS